MTYKLAIDIYHGNGDVDMAAAKAKGVEWVWVKVTQGDGFVDPKGAQNLANALGQGLSRGAYHFGEDSAGGAQASFFLKHIDGARNVALDFESYETFPGSGIWKKMTDAQAKDFATTVNADPALETKAVYGLESDVHRLLNYKQFDGWVGWIADYNGTPPTEPWEFWQYGSIVIGGLTLDADHWKGDDEMTQDEFNAMLATAVDMAVANLKEIGDVASGTWKAALDPKNPPTSPNRLAIFNLVSAPGGGGGDVPAHKHTTPAGETGEVAP